MRIQDLLENSEEPQTPRTRHGFYIVQRTRGDRFEFPGSPTKWAGSAMKTAINYLAQTGLPVRVEMKDHISVFDSVILKPGDRVKDAILNLGKHVTVETWAQPELTPAERAKRRRNKEILQQRSQERIERIRAGLPGANPEWSKDDPFNLNDPIPNVPDDPARVNPPDEHSRKHR